MACRQLHHALGWRDFVFDTEAGSWPATKAKARGGVKGVILGLSPVFSKEQTHQLLSSTNRETNTQSHKYSTTSKQVFCCWHYASAKEKGPQTSALSHT